MEVTCHLDDEDGIGRHFHRILTSRVQATQGQVLFYISITEMSQASRIVTLNKHLLNE